MLEIYNYQKAYGPAPVLHIDHLKLESGIHYLQGANGAGKSTLLKSIAGLISFKGDICLGRINLRKHRMLYTKKVSYAEAEPVYPGFLSGHDLIQFYRQTKEGEPTVIRQMVNDLGMQTYVGNQVGSYSSGMLKKLSLLLAFVGAPGLILLDEPFTTLDKEAVAVLQQTITTYHAAGVSFIITSHHDLALAVPFTILRINQQTIETGSHVAPVI